MAPDQTLICAGFGLRAAATRDDIARAFAAALAAHELTADAVVAVSQPAFKPSVVATWAANAGYRVISIAREQLEQPDLVTLTLSPQVTARYPVGSIAEACALLGARTLAPTQRARLLGPRVSAGSATCALAISESTS